TALYEPRERLEQGLVERALDEVIAHHDVLRCAFDRGRLTAAPTSARPRLAVFDLRSAPAADRASELQRRSAELQASLSAESGAPYAFALFDLGDSQRLLLVLHHLVGDDASLAILREDFEAAYRAAREGRAPELARPATDFAAWARRLHARAQSAEARVELAY